MNTRTSHLARCAPGPAAAGALFEMNGYRFPTGAVSGLDGETALRIWNRGKSSMEVAVSVAQHCIDSAALRKVMKDRRVAVRRAVLENAHCPWDILVEKATWNSHAEKSWTIRSTARSTMESAVARVSFETALGWLGDNQLREGYEIVARHHAATDAQLIEFLTTEYTIGDQVWVGWMGVTQRHDLRRRSDDLLLAIASLSDSKAQVSAAMACSNGDAARIPLAWKMIELFETSESQNHQAARYFYGMQGVGAVFHEQLHERMTSFGRSAYESSHMANPEAPWRLWADSSMDRGGAIPVLGRAIAEMWGDDSAVWGMAGSLLPEFEGTVEQFLQMLEVFHPHISE